MLFCHGFAFTAKDFQILFSLQKHSKGKLIFPSPNSLNPIRYIELCSCPYPLNVPSDIICPPVFWYPQTDLQKTRLSIAVLAIPLPRASSLTLLTSSSVSSSLGPYSNTSTSPDCTSERPSPKLREISLFIFILGTAPRFCETGKHKAA